MQASDSHSGAQVGVHLSKDLMTIAGRALKANITTLAPLVLPFSEQLLFLANLVSRKVLSSDLVALLVYASSFSSPLTTLIGKVSPQWL